MNWRLILSQKVTTEALTTALRIAASIVLVSGGYLGYRFYTNSSKLDTLTRTVRANERKMTELNDQIRRDELSSQGISRRQLETYGPTQFTNMLDALCKRSGGRIVAMRAENAERVAIDNFSGGKGIEGWKVLGHEIDIIGSYRSVQGILKGLAAFPMPFEITALDLTRIGVRDGGAEIELKMTVEVYQSGSHGGAS